MSYHTPDDIYEAFMAHNVPVNMWETPNSPLCVDTNETTFCTQGNINSYNDLDAFVQQHNMVMGNECFESEACPESSMFPLTTGLYGGGCDYRPNEISQTELPSSAPISTHGSDETDTTLHTDKELSLNLKQFRTTINQLGVLSQTLSTKIEGLNSRFDDMEHGLENMEHRMESLENSMVKLYQGTESLEASFKTVNGYLLEVIRREQMVMQELGELASR